VAAGWSVGAPRIDGLDDRLSTLVATASEEDQRSRALALRDAVRASRSLMAALATDGGEDWETRLDEAQAPLLASLVPPP
jgi:hypothetical protein